MQKYRNSELSYYFLTSILLALTKVFVRQGVQVPIVGFPSACGFTLVWIFIFLKPSERFYLFLGGSLNESYTGSLNAFALFSLTIVPLEEITRSCRIVLAQGSLKIPVHGSLN